MQMFFLVLALVLFLVAGVIAHLPPPEYWWRRMVCFGLAAWVCVQLVPLIFGH